MIINTLFLSSVFLISLGLHIQPENEDSRNTLFVIIMGLYAIIRSVIGLTIIVDEVAMAMMVMATWVMLSMLWTTTIKSTLEVCTWIGYMVLAYASRGADARIVMGVVGSVGLYWSVVILYGVLGNRFNRHNTFAGNNNHGSSFLLLSMISCLWWGYNVHPISFVLMVIIGIAIVKSQCKGGLVAVLGLMGTLVVHLLGEEAGIIGLLVTGIIIVIWGYRFYNKDTGKHRLLLYRSAIKMIKLKPLFGWGMNAYRKYLPDMQAGEGMDIIGGSHSHRVHNDHLEIIVELGIVGYLILVYLILMGPSTIEYRGLVIVTALSGMFFFPLREVHIAAAFWVMVGVMMGKPVAGHAVVLDPLIVIVVAAALMIIAGRKMLAMCYLEVAKKEVSKEVREKLLDMALGLDPHNTTILAHTTIHHMETGNQDRALVMSLDSIVNFNGDIQKWNLLDQLSRILYLIDTKKVSSNIINESLRLNRQYEGSIIMKQIIGREEVTR